MSRIRVLNLPRSLQEDEVKRFFTSKLPQGSPNMEITDVCIKKDKADTTKTRMLFVGFKTAAAGTFAVKHFNQTYFKTSKISVETAAGLADAPLSHKVKMEQRAKEQEERKRMAAEKRERDANASAFGTSGSGGGNGGDDADADRKRRREEFIRARTENAGGPSWASELMLPETDPDNATAANATTGFGSDVSAAAAAAAGPSSAKQGAKRLIDGVEVDDDDNAYKMQHARSLQKAKARKLKELEAEIAKAEGRLNGDDDDEGEDAEEERKQEELAKVADDDFLASLMSSGGGSGNKKKTQTTDDFSDEENDAAGVKGKRGNNADDDDDDADANEDGEGGLSSASASASRSRGATSSSAAADPSHSVGFGFGEGYGDGGDETEEDIAKLSRRVRVGNLPYSATADDIRNFASSLVGSVAEVHIPMTRDTKESKGAAFVLFTYADDAVAALTKLKGAVFMGRLLRVSAARPDPHANAREAWQQSALAALAAGDTMDGSGATFKAKKLAQQQAADQKGLSWSATYMSTSAAVQSMADRLKVDAGQIVSVDAGGAAVRAAVAEAFLTSEAKAILGDEGISFDVINDAALHKARSNTTILVKNLTPLQTRDDSFMAELIKMFRKFGTLETIASPSSRLFALFGFLHPQDARVAFQRLSYKKFNGAPLFLEWAPMGCIKDDEDGGLGADSAVGAGAGAEGAAATAVVDLKHQPQYSLYVTNLPKGNSNAKHNTAATTTVTDEAMLEFISEHCPKVAREPKRYVTGLRILNEKGQAFISCADKTTQQYILAKLNGRDYGGRVIKVEISTSVAASVPDVITADLHDGAGGAVGMGSGSGSSSTAAAAKAAGASSVPPGCDPHKVIVKNLPFEATEKDLRELFAAFSDVKSVRVPKRLHKFGAHRENNHRGFGFVEFLTEQEAANAIRTLSATHLYGRHLVLQYAKKDDDGAM